MLDPIQRKAHGTLGGTLHTVHGTFGPKRGTARLALESGNAGGEIVAEATSGAGGNDPRNKKMRQEILESAPEHN
jgi:hypothetical protein